MLIAGLMWEFFFADKCLKRGKTGKISIRNYINKVSVVYVSSCSNTGSIRDHPYWTSRENNLELMELSSINKVSLV